jgi:hypothetical protein
MRVSVNAMGKPSKAKSASQVAKGRKQPRVASVPRSKHSRGAPPLQTTAFGPPGLAHPLDRALQQQQQQADEEEEDLFGGLPGVNSTLRTLVMDVSYTAVDVVSWQRAICLDILEKVEVTFPCSAVDVFPSRLLGAARGSAAAHGACAATHE